MRIAITGGASGIGAETVRQLEQDGHQLVIFDITKPAAGPHHYIHLDLDDPASISAAISAVDGGFDALCNIAGIPPRDDNARQCLSVNMLGTIEFTRQFMARAEPVPAAVISLASKAGFGWETNLDQLDDLLACPPDELADWIKANAIDPALAYRLSKQAIIYWTQLQAASWLGQTRFASVSPSAVQTGILDAFIDAFGEQTRANLAQVGRPGKPEEIAALVCFLLSGGAGWMNGVDLVADGGMGAANLAKARGYLNS